MKAIFSLVLTAALLRFSYAALGASGIVETVLDSGKPGPTVLLLNKPATNDISGAVAIGQISSWTLAKGKIVATTNSDLAEVAKSVTADAVIVFQVVRVTKTNGPAATLSARGVDGTPLLKKLNGLLDAGTNPGQLADPPAMATALKAPALVELSFFVKSGSATPSERARLFRHLAHEILTAQAMTTTSPWTVINPATRKIKAAVYAGAGSSTTPGLTAYPACLDRAAEEIDYTYIGPRELSQPGMLDPFDVVIFCGGTGGGQAKAIGEAGAAAVKAFVKKGGGYVSSCAGSYLATCSYSWSLKLVDADTVDSAHWARGMGQVDIEVTEEGRKILGDFKGLQSVRYANGPLLGKAKDSGGLAPYTVLAYFRSDMAKGKNTPKGIMPNTPAIIAGTYGQGRVVCCSPHPEYTDAVKDMIPRAVKWAAKRP